MSELPWTITVGPPADLGVEPEDDRWRWHVYDADGVGVSATEPTKEAAEKAMVDEIAEWWPPPTS